MGRVLAPFVLVLLVLAVAVPVADAADDQTRIIVGRDPGLSAAERADIRDDAGVDFVQTLRIPDTEVVAADDPSDALAALRSDPDVRYAEIDHVRHAFATNDLGYEYLWAIENTGQLVNGTRGITDDDMDVPEAWSAAPAAGAGIRVAVVDTGVQGTHPDLAGQIAGGRNFTSSGTYKDDQNGHGTHVTGTIVALRNNTEGIVGIAPSAKVVSLKALDSTGSGSDSAIANAFDYAGDQGIRVVNASLGGPGSSTVLTQAIASHPNTVYVVAAGNENINNDTTPVFPCDAPADNVVCVGASTQSDTRASFSDYGANTVDVFAPGVNIASTWTGGAYMFEQGTSMASPAVAAEAALVLAAKPTLSTTQLKAVILQSGDARGALAGKSVTGRRVNAANAIRLATGALPADADRDGTPDVSDSTPYGADADRDGVPALRDACPTIRGTLPNGCAPATVAKQADRDGDGRTDSLDACPAEFARTSDGCPIPALLSLSVKVSKKRTAVARVRADRAARFSLKFERKRCRAHGKHCRWKKVTSRTVTSAAGRATLRKKLRRGTYRIGVSLASNAGRSKTKHKSFKVR